MSAPLRSHFKRTAPTRAAAAAAGLLLITATAAGCSALSSQSGSSESGSWQSGDGDAQTQPKSDSAPLRTTTASPDATATTQTDTKAAQQHLADVGCYAGAVDGVPGEQTKAAVTAFQQATGLTADGQLGPQTAAALKAAATAGKTSCAKAPTELKPGTDVKADADPKAPTAGGGLCTDDSVVAALNSDENVIEYSCADASSGQWAAGKQSAGPDTSSFFLRANGKKWTVVPNDEACGGESAALPDAILRYCGVGPVGPSDR